MGVLQMPILHEMTIGIGIDLIEISMSNSYDE